MCKKILPSLRKIHLLEMVKFARTRKNVIILTLFFIGVVTFLYKHAGMTKLPTIILPPLKPEWINTIEMLRELDPLIKDPAYYHEKPNVEKYFHWPVPEHPKDPKNITNAERSSYKLMYQDNTLQNPPKLGSELLLKIEARNGWGEQKSFGGDYFRVLLTSDDLITSVAGAVTDNEDGTYSVTVPVTFYGNAFLDIYMMLSSEGVDLLRRVTSTKSSPGLLFQGVFQDKMSEEKTECNVWIPSMKNASIKEFDQNFCNFSHKPTGEPWFCKKPQYLDCSTIARYEVSRTHDASILLENSKLFIPGFNMRVRIGARKKLLIDDSGVNPHKDRLSVCKLQNIGSLPPHPGGYYFEDTWHSLHCSSKDFSTLELQAQCLQNKVVYLLGDSTIRQWYSYFVKSSFVAQVTKMKSKINQMMGFVPKLSMTEITKTKSLWEPREAKDWENNVTLQFSAHGPPLQNGGSPYSMPYIADRIDKIPGGSNTIVAITIGTHLLLYDPTRFVRRLANIGKAIKRLQSRAPDTLIIFKGFNVFLMDDMKSNQCCLFDWLSYRLDTIARNMIKELKGVIYLDAWDLSSSHYSVPNGLHTQPHVVQNEVNLFLSFVCPDL